jgi:hypothetical protein
MVLPVTLAGCSIFSLLVLLLYPTLVVRFTIRHTLHLPTGTLIVNCMYTLLGVRTVKPMKIGRVAWTLRGGFFFGTQP